MESTDETDADIELHITAIIDSIKEKFSQTDSDGVDVNVRIYTEVFGPFVRIIRDERKKQNDPEVIGNTVVSLMISMLTHIACEMTKPELRVQFIAEVTKLIRAKSTDFVKGRPSDGLQVISVSRSS